MYMYGLPACVLRLGACDRVRDAAKSSKMASFIVRGAERRADLAYRAPGRQLLWQDETNRGAMTSVRFGLKMTLLGR
jgi:hypothetical protein